MRISDWSSDVCSSDLCHVRLISDRLARFVFWGWQAAMVGAVITLPMGITQRKEYAELEWPLDILIAVVWIAYGWLFFGTIAKQIGSASCRDRGCQYV